MISNTKVWYLLKRGISDLPRFWLFAWLRVQKACCLEYCLSLSRNALLSCLNWRDDRSAVVFVYCNGSIGILDYLVGLRSDRGNCRDIGRSESFLACGMQCSGWLLNLLTQRKNYGHHQNIALDFYSTCRRVFTSGNRPSFLVEYIINLTWLRSWNHPRDLYHSEKKIVVL